MQFCFKSIHIQLCPFSTQLSMECILPINVTMTLMHKIYFDFEYSNIYQEFNISCSVKMSIRKVNWLACVLYFLFKTGTVHWLFVRSFEPRHEKTNVLHMRKTKTQISFAVSAKLISAFVFAT